MEDFFFYLMSLKSLVLPLVLLLGAYFIGSAIERRHFRAQHIAATI